MINIFKIVVIVEILFGFAIAQANLIELNQQKSKVEFLAIGRPSAIKIRGEGGSAKGTINIGTEKTIGEIQVNLDDFKTGMSKRDEHMKTKYLELGKAENKTATLKISNVKLPKDYWTTKPEMSDVKFYGTLRLHGVEKNVEGNLNLKKAEGNVAQGNSKFTIKLPDYGITIPSFAGITVAEDVDVTVNFEAKLIEK